MEISAFFGKVVAVCVKNVYNYNKVRGTKWAAKQDRNACRRICGRMGLHGGAP